MLLNGLLHLLSAEHVSGTYMPIIGSSRLYVCYYRIWCVMPWLLVVGGQVQGGRVWVWDQLLELHHLLYAVYLYLYS